MHRRAQTHATCREERRRFAKLTEIGITSTEIEAEVREIAGVHCEPNLASKTEIVDHIRETHVIDPQFERIVGHDRRTTARDTVDANEADGQLLHAGKIGRRHTRIGAVDDVAFVTHSIPPHGDAARQSRSLDHFEISAGTRERILGRRQEIVLQLRAQNLELRQIDTHLRIPCCLRRP